MILASGRREGGKAARKPVAKDKAKKCAGTSGDGGDAAHGASSADGMDVSPSGSDLARQVDAADDAWIACVVELEKLQKPGVASGQSLTLLAELKVRYDRFRRALQPIERLIARGAAPP